MDITNCEKTGNSNKKLSVHFIGIGGIGMSALAGICLDYGFEVSGSDLSSNHNTKKLEQKGAYINYIHSAKNISEGCGIVVFSSAIKPENPEIVQAIKMSKCLIERHKFLGILFNGFTRSIAVSGSHGKTTCTGILAGVLIQNDTDPEIFLGGNIDTLGGLNYRKGEGCALAEACEYKDNFLSLKPSVGVVLNIEKDHMDYFRDVERLISGFDRFVKNIKPGGTAVINGDDEYCRQLIAMQSGDKNIITFGMSEKNDCYASEIKRYKGRYSFTVVYKGERHRIKLRIFGRHNIMNALAAFCVCRILNLDTALSIQAIESFKGVKRRFEYAGTFCGADVIKDYAHHPRELKAVIDSAGEIYKERLTAVFQPHTYSRTKALMPEFCECFDGLDVLILLPVYSAREAYDKEGSTAALYENLRERKKEVVYLDSFSQAREHLKTLNSSVILLLGAGDIDKLADILK